MPPRMNSWLGVVLGGLLVIGIWGIPPETYEESRRNRPPPSRRLRLPERQAHIELSAEIRQKNREYQRIQWWDSVSVLAQASSELNRPWTGALPPSAPDSLLSRLAQAVTTQLATNDVVEPLVQVGTVLMGARWGSHPDYPMPPSGFSYGMEVHVGRGDGTPFCFLVDPIRGGEGDRVRSELNLLLWTPSGSSSGPTPLGPCLLHAKYGEPGAEILRWLAGGRYAMASGGRALRRGGLGREGGRVTAYLGRGRRAFWFTGSPSAEACLAGRLEGCRAALLDTIDVRRGWWSPTPETVFDSKRVIAAIPDLGYRLPFGGWEGQLLWDMEKEFGSSRFREFWVSDLDVEAAFFDAFGIGLPEWTMGWAQNTLGKAKISPVVPLNAGFLSFLSVGLFASVALFLGKRRG